MRPRHRRHIDGLAICGGCGCATAIVSEAVLDTDDDPDSTSEKAIMKTQARDLP